MSMKTEEDCGHCFLSIRRNHEGTNLSLIKAHADHCIGCSLLSTGIERFYKFIKPLESIEPDPKVSWYPRSDKFSTLFAISGSSDRKHYIEVFQRTGSLEALKNLGIGQTLPYITSSPESINHISEWLSECSTNHACKPSQVTSKLPSRVLYVGWSDLAPSFIRLYESGGEHAHYACLSHCWGTANVIATTNANLSVHKRGIQASSLSQTFRDTIEVTRRLGIDYLWIDSLCIIQDNPNDWATESANMAEIYQNSYLTIAATCASDGSEGLFSQKSSREETIRATVQGREFEIVVRQPLKHLGEWGRGGIPDQSGFPLLTRAWAFQERILAPRVVYFCENELVWECGKLRICECGSDRFSGVSKKADHWKVLKPAITDMDLYDIRSRWHEMVEEYTMLHLTYASDLLPALSGVVKQMGEFRQGRYLAGLWEDNLVMDLLWKTPLSQHPKRAKPWRAPTWSWASVDSPISYGGLLDFNRITYCQIVKAETQHATSDPTGRVLSGTIKIMGRLKAAKLQPCSSDYPTFSGDGSEPYPFELQIGTGKTKYFFQDYDIWVEKNSSEDFIPLYCLRVAYIYEADYLLVLKIVDWSEQIYERVGLAEQRYHEEAEWTAIEAGDDQHSLFAGVIERVVTIV